MVRDTVKTVRLSIDESRLLARLAGDAGRSDSEYVRELLRADAFARPAPRVDVPGSCEARAVARPEVLQVRVSEIEGEAALDRAERARVDFSTYVRALLHAARKVRRRKR